MSRKDKRYEPFTIKPIKVGRYGRDCSKCTHMTTPEDLGVEVKNLRFMDQPDTEITHDWTCICIANGKKSLPTIYVENPATKNEKGDCAKYEEKFIAKILAIILNRKFFWTKATV